MTRLIPRKPLTFQSEHARRYPEDVARLIRVAAQAGYTLDAPHATMLWESYSEDWAAGWIGMGLITDEELARILVKYGEIQQPSGQPPARAFIWGAPEDDAGC